MENFVLLATPIWVNILIFVPILLFWYYRKNKLTISNNILFKIAIFGIAFGFIEATVVVYLRAAIGFLPGYKGTLAEVWKQAESFYYNQQLVVKDLPQSLLTVEFLREAFTIALLLSVAFIAGIKMKERIAIFLWAFAFWDIFYYVFLYLMIRWPAKLTTPDLLFMIPVPWTSQVWFPILVSGLTIVVIFTQRRKI